MKHVPKQSWFKSLAVSLCLVGCVSLGLKKSAANATSANSVARDEASADLPQNQKPQPFSVSGTVARANGTGVGGVTITFLRNIGSGSLPGSVVTSADGHWSQSGFETLTSYIGNLSRPGFTFQPAAATFSGARSDLNFEGLTDPFSFSGKVTTSFKNLDSGSSTEVGVSGATISFSRVSGPGRVPTAVTTDSIGHWTQSGFEGDTVYRASPNKQGFDFNPTSAEFRDVKPVTELSFEARKNTFDVSGTVSILGLRKGIANVGIFFSTPPRSIPTALPGRVFTDSQGKWRQSGFLFDTTYEATPQEDGFAFTPSRVEFFGAGNKILDFEGIDLLYSVSGFAYFFAPTSPSIPGATITFSATGGEKVPSPVTTDAQGNWHQSGFTRGVTYHAVASKTGITFGRTSEYVFIHDGPENHDATGEFVFVHNGPGNLEHLGFVSYPR